MGDHIAPTYAGGTFSIISTNQVSNLNSDYYNQSNSTTGSTIQGGYINVIENVEVGSFNADFNNNILSKAPVNQVSQQS